MAGEVEVEVRSKDETDHIVYMNAELITINDVVAELYTFQEQHVNRTGVRKLRLSMPGFMISYQIRCVKAPTIFTVQ
jgi:hypothetical protein